MKHAPPVNQGAKVLPRSGIGGLNPSRAFHLSARAHSHSTLLSRLSLCLYLYIYICVLETLCGVLIKTYTKYGANVAREMVISF